MSDRNPTDLLPLKPLEFSILLALSEGASYGYRIAQSIRTSEGGGVTLSPGNLYHVLDRMIARELIRADERRSADESGGAPRQYYAITPFGRRVARAEVGRMEAVMQTARTRLASSAGGES